MRPKLLIPALDAGKGSLDASSRFILLSIKPATCQRQTHRARIYALGDVPEGDAPVVLVLPVP